jgi:hypothetical protein
MDQEMEESVVGGRDGTAELGLDRNGLIPIDQVASKAQ